MSASYDLIVIGGGHNGLVTAAYAARAGVKVLVLERREVLGGACVTEELWPGFKVSTAAYVNSLLRPEIIRDLELKRHGFKMLPRNPSSFTPFPDGRSLLLGPYKAQTHKEVAKFSEKDADALPKYERMLERVAAFIEPTLIEADTYRFRGHSMRDPAGAVYRTKEEVEREKQRDPIVLFSERCLKDGALTEADLKNIEKAVNDLVDEAVAFAEASPEPPPEELFTDVYKD